VLNFTDKQNNKQITVTQIKDNQFLVEGRYDTMKMVGENEYCISYIDIEDGPFLHVGKDFLGMGTILRLEPIDSSRDNYMIIKVFIG
jgi:hypothetical protein